MDFKNDNMEGFFSEDANREEKHTMGELFVARESGEEYLAEEVEELEEDIPNWGVYLQGKEKTLLGLFWDKELANLFLHAVENSRILEKVKEIA